MKMQEKKKNNKNKKDVMIFSVCSALVEQLCCKLQQKEYLKRFENRRQNIIHYIAIANSHIHWIGNRTTHKKSEIYPPV